MNAANATIVTRDATIVTLNGQIATLTSNNASLNSQLTAANAQIAILNGQITSLQSQLDSATASNTTLTGQLATATGTIASLNSQVSSLTTQLATANGTIATRDAAIVTLNSTIATLNGQISAMVATPVQIAVNFTAAVVNAPISVTVTFPDSSQDGKTVTFSSPGGGSFTSTTATISGTTASATFSAATPGTYNINALEGLYCGGATVTITPIPATTYSITGTVTLNGTGLQNVTMQLSGAGASSTVTDASGAYSFTGLPVGGYTITPSTSGYKFVPSSSNLTISTANVTDINFADVLVYRVHSTGLITSSAAYDDSYYQLGISPVIAPTNGTTGAYNTPSGLTGTRFIDNGDGTVIDVYNGLTWLKNANCFNTQQPWATALTSAHTLANGACGLTDGSSVGQWRLPNINELHSLGPTWPPSSPFTAVQGSNFYWSSSSNAVSAWNVYMNVGFVGMSNKVINGYVWPVRSGQ